MIAASAARLEHPVRPGIGDRAAQLDLRDPPELTENEDRTDLTVSTETTNVVWSLFSVLYVSEVFGVRSFSASLGLSAVAMSRQICLQGVGGWR